MLVSTRIFIGLIAAIIAMLDALPLAAQPSAERQSTAAALEQSLADVIARVEPSVVAVSRKPPNQPTPADVRAGDVFLDLRQQEADAAAAVVASGVIIDRAGYILTQYLAVREGDEARKAQGAPPPPPWGEGDTSPTGCSGG